MSAVDHQAALARAKAAEAETDTDRLVLVAEKVIASQHASRGLVQRTLRCGWDETTVWLARLAQAGIVAAGSSDSDPAVLIRPEQAADALARIATAPSALAAEDAEVVNDPDFWADLLPAAADIVITAGHASTALLCEQMGVPADDAGDLMAELLDAEIIDMDGRVLVDMAEASARLAVLAGPDAEPWLDDDDLEAANLGGGSVAPRVVEFVKPGVISPAETYDEDFDADDQGDDTTPGNALVVRPGAALDIPDGDDLEVLEDQPRRTLVATVRQGGAAIVTTLGADTPGPRATRAVAQIAWVTGVGGVSVIRRAASAATHGHLREQIRIARLAGDREGVKEWTELLNDARNDRIYRLVKLPQAALGIAAAVGLAAVGVALLLLLLGVVALIAKGGGGWTEWWGGIGAVLGVAGRAIVVAVHVAPWLALPLLAVLAWREGRRQGDPPTWLLSVAEKQIVSADITPSRVIIALRDAGITDLRKYILAADDGGASMLGPIATAGPGMEWTVRPPSGIDTSQILRQRRRLAENMDRHEHELYMSIPAARTVLFWLANSGALDEPVDPSPLVTNPLVKANARAGRAPLGVNLRADAVGVSLWQRHVLITGISNHGKTAILRALALWLAFDTKVMFWLADLKGFGDWAMFQPLAETYISGPADTHVMSATEMLEAAVAEMNRRLMAGGDDWPMLVVIVDEAQKAYMCPVKGDDGRPYGGKSNKSRFFMAARELHNQGRAVNVVLWQGTQDPTDDNLPKIVREGAHIRMSLVVGTTSQAEMALGEAAVNGGAAPHLLRQDIDKGVVVMHGGVDLPRGETSVTVRSHFIDTAPAKQVAVQAIERRRKAGKLPGVIDMPPIEADHLADIYAAMRGEKRPRTVVVLGRLAEENPAEYEKWGADDLARAVREYAHFGLDVRKYGGDSVLRLEEVQKALGMRE